jgi:TP901 family phage tail tape measure protein
VADPIAEAFVRLRADDTGLRTEVQASIRRALAGTTVPAATQRGLAQQMLGTGFVNQFGQIVQTVPATTTIPTATQRTLAQRLFGPGFRNEAGRGIQGALAGLGQGQVAAQFAFFGPGGAAAAVLGGGLLVAADAAITLEQSLEILRTTAQASEAELEQAREVAERLGADLRLPGVSADDAALAITELVKAGLSLDDAFSGAESTIRLAIAAQVDTGTAARIAASGLTAFGLEGVDAARVADLLAGASIAAQGDIGDMALALQQSAAVADQAGLSIEQLVGLITLLAQQGILGSDAGTSIRTMLLRLVPTTKEASAEMERLGVELDGTRTIGEQLPEVIEQYRRALALLPPIQRQAALQQIFGTDAIRSATVAFEAGAQGYLAAEQAANRQGAAAELAESRTRGAAGALSEVRNEAERFALFAGNTLLPTITETAEGFADLISIVNETVEVLQDLSAIDVPGPIGSIGGTLREMVTQSNPVLGTIKRVGILTDALGLTGDEAEATSEKLADIGKAFQGAIQGALIEIQAIQQTFRLADTLGITPEELQRIESTVKREGTDAGFALGRALMDGVAGGITENEQRAIDAARASLNQIRADGERRLLDAIRSARSNLESLGNTLSDALGDIIDEGPIGDKLDALNDELDALEERTSRRQLRFDLSQAEDDLEDMRRALTTIGEITPEQRRAQNEFLEPFQQKVDDAKAKLKEFSLDEAIEEQERLRDEAKRAAEEGLQRLIDDFEEGRVSAGEFTSVLQRQLRPALDIIERENLGLSFERGFLRDVRTLVEQVKELAPFVGTPGTEPGVTPISPGATQAEVNRAIADGQLRLAQAVEDANRLTKEERDKLDSMIGLLRRLVRSFEGRPKQTAMDKNTVRGGG